MFTYKSHKWLIMWDSQERSNTTVWLLVIPTKPQREKGCSVPRNIEHAIPVRASALLWRSPDSHLSVNVQDKHMSTNRRSSIENFSLMTATTLTIIKLNNPTRYQKFQLRKSKSFRTWIIRTIKDRTLKTRPRGFSSAESEFLGENEPSSQRATTTSFP